MILILEARLAIQSLYLRALGELLEDCLVAPSIGALQQLLRELPRIDLVIAPLEVEVFGLIDPGASVVISEVIKQLRPEAAFLGVTHESRQVGHPSTHLVSTASPDFPRQLKLAVKRTLTNRFGRAIVYRVCDRMNNVANAISGTAQLAMTRHGAELPEAVKHSLTAIHEQAMRIGRITKKLNNLAPSEMEIIYDGAVPMISFSDSED